MVTLERLDMYNLKNLNIVFDQCDQILKEILIESVCILEQKFADKKGWGING